MPFDVYPLTQEGNLMLQLDSTSLEGQNSQDTKAVELGSEGMDLLIYLRDRVDSDTYSISYNQVSGSHSSDESYMDYTTASSDM